MLPLDSPAFDAVPIEDRICVCLMGWRDSRDAETASAFRAEAADVWLPQLYTLARERYDSHPGILRTLDRLRDVILTGSYDQAWEAFLDLAERAGDNFGTWAI